MRALLPMLFAASAAALCFAPTLGYDFATADDAVYVAGNPRLQRGLTPANVGWALTTTEAQYWMPATWLSFLADLTFFGPNPKAMHRTNVALHAANAGLLCLALLEFGASPPLAGATAALFAVHPLRVESVAQVAERKGLLCAFFILLAVLSYSREKGKRRPTVPTLVFGALALMSKPTGVVLPALLLCLDYWPLRRAKRGKRLALFLEKWPLWLMSAADAAATGFAERGNVGALSYIPLKSKVEIALLEIAVYLKRTAAPSWETPVFSFMGADPAIRIPSAAAAFSSAAIVALTLAAIKTRRKAPWLSTGWAWFLLALLPTLGLVRFTPGAFCGRFTYLPHLGLAFLAAGAAAKAAPRWILLGACAAAAWFVPATLHNLAAWRTGDALVAREIEIDPDNAWAQNQRGTQLTLGGRAGEAVEHFEKAASLRPQYLPAFNNLAVALAEAGRFDEADAGFARALALTPDGVVTLNREIARKLRARPENPGPELQLILIGGMRFQL